MWDVASGEKILELKHSREVKDVLFSEDGTRLTTVTADGKIRIHFFDVEKLKKVAQEHIENVTQSLTQEEGKGYLKKDLP